MKNSLKRSMSLSTSLDSSWPERPPASTVILKSASLEDVAAICDLEYELFPNNNFNEVTLAHELQLGGGIVLYDGQKLVGYSLLAFDGNLTDLLRLGVAKEYQGCGYGSQILNKILMDYRQVMLCVTPDNKNAMRLYLRYGFKIIGRLSVGADAWVLST